MAEIYYEVQTNLLTSASDYQDLHANLGQGCRNLIGTAGITAANCREVKDATLATQMNLGPILARTPRRRNAPPAGLKTNLFFDNLENPASGNWTKHGTKWYYPQNSYPLF